MKEVEIQAVPTFVIGDEVIQGFVNKERLVNVWS